MATLPANALCVYHFDADTNDALGNSSVTSSGASLSTSQSKFGSKSLYFSGTTNNYFKIDLSTTGINTIAFWMYKITPVSSYPTVFSTTTSGVASRGIYAHAKLPGNEYGRLGLCQTNDGAYVEANTSSVIAANTWVHVAIVRNGTSHKLYIGGVSKASFTTSYSPVFSSVILGGLYESGSIGAPFAGYISEYIETSDSLWTADFTPPTDAYVTPSKSNTLFFGMNF